MFRILPNSAAVSGLTPVRSSICARGTARNCVTSAAQQAGSQKQQTTRADPLEICSRSAPDMLLLFAYLSFGFSLLFCSVSPWYWIPITCVNLLRASSSPSSTISGRSRNRCISSLVILSHHLAAVTFHLLCASLEKASLQAQTGRGCCCVYFLSMSRMAL